jgi:HemY protein
MAELEEGEKGDTDASRGWLKRAALAEPDAAWVCEHCGNVVAEWEPVCGRCQRFDSFTWKTPPRVMHMDEAAADHPGPVFDGAVEVAESPPGAGAPA